MIQLTFCQTQQVAGMRERERCGCLLSGTSRCMQLRRGMNQQHFDPFTWQNQTKAAHLVGKENGTQVLEEGQFQRETTGDTQPEDWQGAGNISGTGYNRVHLCLTELRSFTQSVFAGLYQKGHSCRGDGGRRIRDYHQPAAEAPVVQI